MIDPEYVKLEEKERILTKNSLCSILSSFTMKLKGKIKKNEWRLDY